MSYNLILVYISADITLK